MSQSQSPIDSFIPDSVGSKDILFENAPLVGTVEFFDGILVLVPGVAGLFVLDAIPFVPYPIIASMFLWVAGLLLLVIKPNYLSLFTWVRTLRDYRRRPTDLEKNMTGSDGKPFESYQAVPDEDTRILTKVSSVYPERRAIELDNGDMVSILEFSGSNLDMASPQIKLNTVKSYSASVSSKLDHDIQFYLPMRPVSLDTSVRRYEDELESDSRIVENNRYMQEYLNDRIAWLEGLGDSSFVREQYVVVKVTSSEVYEDDISVNQSSLNKIPGGKVVKDIKDGLTGNVEVKSKGEVRRKKLRELRNRCENIGSALSIGPGNDYSIAETQKSVSLIKEFWEGEKILEDEMNSMSSEYPFPVLEKQGDKND